MKHKISNKPLSKLTKPRHISWKNLSWAVFTILLLLLLLAGLLITPTTRAHLLTYRLLPVPLGMSGGNFIWSNQLPNQSFTDKTQFLAAVTHAGTLAQLKSIVRRNNISFNQKDLANIESELIQHEANGSQEIFERILKEAYRTNLEEFRSFWLPVSHYNLAIKTWYNGQQSLNPETYQTLSIINQKLETGEPFAKLVETYSHDASSVPFEGNLGKIYSSALLPEFKVTLKQAEEKSTYIIASRHGVHILHVNVVQKTPAGEIEWLQAEQIFLKTQGFESWLAAQKQRNMIKYFVNLN